MSASPSGIQAMDEDFDVNVQVTLNTAGSYSAVTVTLPVPGAYVVSTPFNARFTPSCTAGICTWTLSAPPLDASGAAIVEILSVRLRYACWSQAAAPTGDVSFQASLAAASSTAGAIALTSNTASAPLHTGANAFHSITHDTWDYENVNPRWTLNPSTHEPGLAFNLKVQVRDNGAWPIASALFHGTLGAALTYVGRGFTSSGAAVDASWTWLDEPAAWSRDPADRDVVMTRAGTVGALTPHPAGTCQFADTPRQLLRMWVPCSALPHGIAAADILTTGDTFVVESGEAETFACTDDASCDAVCDDAFDGVTRVNPGTGAVAQAPCACRDAGAGVKRCGRAYGPTQVPNNGFLNTTCFAPATTWTTKTGGNGTKNNNSVGLGGTGRQAYAMAPLAGVVACTDAFVSDVVPAGTTLKTLATPRPSDDFVGYACHAAGNAPLTLSAFLALKDTAACAAGSVTLPSGEPVTHVVWYAPTWGATDGADGLQSFSATMDFTVPLDYAAQGHADPIDNAAHFRATCSYANPLGGAAIDASIDADDAVTIDVISEGYTQLVFGGSTPAAGTVFAPGETLAINIGSFYNSGAAVFNTSIAFDDLPAGVEAVGFDSLIRGVTAPAHGACNAPPTTYTQPTSATDPLVWTFGDNASPYFQQNLQWEGCTNAKLTVRLDPSHPWLDDEPFTLCATGGAANLGPSPPAANHQCRTFNVRVLPGVGVSVVPTCPESGEPEFHVVLANTSGVDLTSYRFELAMPRVGDVLGSTGVANFRALENLPLGALVEYSTDGTTWVTEPPIVALLVSRIRVTLPFLAAYTSASFDLALLADSPSGTLQLAGIVDADQLLEPAVTDAVSFEIDGCRGTIDVFKFHDADGDGVQGDPALEPPLAGWVFEVTDAEGAAVDTITTGPDGHASAWLHPGTYHVSEVLPTGFAGTWLDTGNLDQDAVVALFETTPLAFANQCGCPSPANKCLLAACAPADDGHGNQIVPLCSYPANPCEDGDVCTDTSCSPQTGCAYAPVDCSDGNGCTDDLCDPTGGCMNPPSLLGTACSDEDACTLTDQCDGEGACVGVNDVVCEAADACHVAGTCDPATGACSSPAAPDDTACDDGDMCTNDSCQGGVCVGEPLAPSELAAAWLWTRPGSDGLVAAPRGDDALPDGLPSGVYTRWAATWLGADDALAGVTSLAAARALAADGTIACLTLTAARAHVYAELPCEPGEVNDLGGLGRAGDLNGLVCGDHELEQWDVAGRLGVAGDLTLQGFSVGLGIEAPGGDPQVQDSEDEPAPVLFCGGFADLASGQVYGSAWEVAGHDDHLGTGNLVEGGRWERGDPRELAFACHDMEELSLALGGATPTAIPRVAWWGDIELTGTSHGTNVFALEAADVAAAVGVDEAGLTNPVRFVVDVPADATVLVNMGGAEVAFGDGEFRLGGVDASAILFNFAEATRVAIANYGFSGSILAPFADLSFANGYVDGQAIVRTFSHPVESSPANLRDRAFGGDLSVRTSCGGLAPDGIEPVPYYGPAPDVVYGTPSGGEP
ncbi:MAG: choice-of-anchor A family protein [Myxococcales bacterium]|nr:choice-of-anchor A family protein [Myxococcales bacterium]